MRLLAIETAYDICGAAVMSAEGVEGLEEEPAPRRHNEQLAPAVQRVMQSAGRAYEDLDAIAISVGPGGYTGLRVGMSYVKGLAFGTGLPLIPVPTLPSLLAGETVAPDWVVTWSHGENVYALRTSGFVPPGEVRFLPWEEFLPLAKNQTIAGYLLERFLPPAGITIIPTVPSAEKVGRYALENRLKPVEEPGTLVPDYHNDFTERLSRHAHS
ncbi:MAG: tRNA (adenosine(37)-N6)-threonylcarbamoyltransferase complex dimerization subunit type 1 TsaB [Candidatus Neomarinimicrobiota bacterium]